MCGKLVLDGLDMLPSAVDANLDAVHRDSCFTCGSFGELSVVNDYLTGTKKPALRRAFVFMCGREEADFSAAASSLELPLGIRQC